MARYLTPTRVATLLLIELYRKQQFWTINDKATTTILALVARQCLPDTEEEAQLSSIVDGRGIVDALDFVKPLVGLDASLPGRPWSSIVLYRIWSLHTVDQLHDLFESSCNLLASASPTDSQPNETQAAAITRASPIGQFIRRCYVEFTRLQFAETIELWEAFLSFREPSKSQWAQQFPDAAHELAELHPNDDIVSSLRSKPRVPHVSTDTIEAVLTASVIQLQKLGHRVPREVKTQIEHWIGAQQAYSASSLHKFMSFFDAWRAGQYTLALENLHRYFDYTVGKGDGEELKTHYQYALLHLSVLHADFEHWDESVESMRECIATGWS